MDCTKRNIVYNTKCLTCENREFERIDELEKDDKEKNERKKKVKRHKYIGVTSRSSYKPGIEHLDKLTSLKSNSQMLKQIVSFHEGGGISLRSNRE